MGGLLSIFADSPFKPIQEHMKVVIKSVEQLLPFIDAVYASNWELAREQRNKISYYEGQADDVKASTILKLPNGIFLPVSRQDIIELISSQDRIANKAKDLAGIIIGRRMNFPKQISVEYLSFIKCSIKATKQAAQVIGELDELLATGFKGREVDLVKNMLEELSKLEKESDKLQVEIRTHLYELEKQLDPVDVIFLYKIIDWTGDLADRAQYVGNKLLLLLAN